VTQGGVEFYSSDIQDSPIAREDFETEVGLTLLWHF
jgi:outer membrane scaffolding protein for murein synthesis (MipA/OmpV family)